MTIPVLEVDDITSALARSRPRPIAEFPAGCIFCKEAKEGLRYFGVTTRAGDRAAGPSPRSAAQ